MDTEVLNQIPDCKTCNWWYDLLGVCEKPKDVDCPKGVRQPQQEFAKE